MIDKYQLKQELERSKRASMDLPKWKKIALANARRVEVSRGYIS
jgi:hypothetical protein